MGLSPELPQPAGARPGQPLDRLLEAAGRRPGERVADLLADPDPEGLVLRRGQRPAWRLARVRYEQLAPGRRAPAATPAAALRARRGPGPAPGRHEGEEFGLVLQGRVECAVGERVFVLEEGDSVCFDARLPHRTRNAGPGESVYLLVVTPATF